MESQDRNLTVVLRLAALLAVAGFALSLPLQPTLEAAGRTVEHSSLGRYEVERWQVVNPADERAFFYLLLEEVREVLVGKRPSKLPFQRSVALLVGVSKYETLIELPFVANDLKNLREALLYRAGFDEVLQISEEAVSREAIEWLMTDYLAGYLKPEDRLLFYYSGHGADKEGGGTGYILFRNSIEDVFYKDVLEIDRVREWSRVIPAAHILFLFDSCSAGVSFSPASTKFPNKTRALLRTLSKGGSRRVITAGTGGQKAFEVSGNGVFTRALLDSLQEGTPEGYFMTVEDLFAAVQRKVAVWSLEQDQTLTPRMWQLQSNEFPGTFIFLNNPSAATNPRKEEVDALLLRPRSAKGPQEIVLVDQQRELELWLTIKDSKDATDFKYFLEQFPDGTYARAARQRLQKLEDLVSAHEPEDAQQYLLERAATDTADSQEGFAAAKATVNPTPAQVQAELRRLDVYTGQVDGVWGPASKQAAQDYAAIMGDFDVDLLSPEGFRKLSSVESVFPEMELNGAFAGFSCAVSSVGGSWAEQIREQVSRRLYTVYGCTLPPDTHSLPGWKAEFYSPTLWPGFAWRSTVLFYDQRNAAKAHALARDLTLRFRHRFWASRGAGLGIRKESFPSTLVIHIREPNV